MATNNCSFVMTKIQWNAAIITWRPAIVIVELMLNMNWVILLTNLYEVISTVSMVSLGALRPLQHTFLWLYLSKFTLISGVLLDWF